MPENLAVPMNGTDGGQGGHGAEQTPENATQSEQEGSFNPEEASNAATQEPSMSEEASKEVAKKSSTSTGVLMQAPEASMSEGVSTQVRVPEGPSMPEEVAGDVPEERPMTQEALREMSEEPEASTMEAESSPTPAEGEGSSSNFTPQETEAGQNSEPM